MCTCYRFRYLEGNYPPSPRSPPLGVNMLVIPVVRQLMLGTVAAKTLTVTGTTQDAFKQDGTVIATFQVRTDNT